MFEGLNVVPTAFQGDGLHYRSKANSRILKLAKLEKSIKLCRNNRARQTNRSYTYETIKIGGRL